MDRNRVELTTEDVGGGFVTSPAVDDLDPSERLHPTVEGRLHPAAVEEQFRQLFLKQISHSGISLNTVAERLNMSARSLHRILIGEQKLNTQTLVEFGNALEIHKSRATVAIEQFHDWRMYYDPTLITAFNLLRPVVEMVNQAANKPLEPLHPKAVEQLARWIADAVIRHDEQVSARREGIDLDSKI